MSETGENRLEELQNLEPSVAEFHASVIDGLSALQKTLPCKFLYDERGSQIFDNICELPEYYPTRTERHILERHALDIAALTGPDARLIEFGSGAGTKIRLLLRALDRPAAYLPVDISREHLIAANEDLAENFAELHIAPVCADYTEPFDLPELLGPGGVMIVGVDLVKDLDTLRAAYNDGAGVTGAFNLNLLRRINRELGGTFELANFRHEARWNEDLERIEMHLVSQCDQSVVIGTKRFRFGNGETVHTESSYKYRLDGFRELAREAGYEPLEVWTDKEMLFSVHALRAL